MCAFACALAEETNEAAAEISEAGEDADADAADGEEERLAEGGAAPPVEAVDEEAVCEGFVLPSA